MSAKKTTTKKPVQESISKEDEAVQKMIDSVLEAIITSIDSIPIDPPKDLTVEQLSAWLAGYGQAINDVKAQLSDDKKEGE